MHIILIVLVVYRACHKKFLCRQIADRPFQAAGRDLAESPQMSPSNRHEVTRQARGQDRRRSQHQTKKN